MVDGTIARKTNATSKFGARLDSIVDFIFMIVTVIKILPWMHFTIWLWMWIIVIAIIKISNVVCGFICKKRLISMHTFMNKIMGAFLFLLPLTLYFIEIKYSFVGMF